MYVIKNTCFLTFDAIGDWVLISWQTDLGSVGGVTVVVAHAVVITRHTVDGAVYAVIVLLTTNFITDDKFHFFRFSSEDFRVSNAANTLHGFKYTIN